MGAIGTTYLPLSRNPFYAVLLVLHTPQGSNTSKPARPCILALWMAPVVVRIIMWSLSCRKPLLFIVGGPVNIKDVTPMMRLHHMTKVKGHLLK